ncbi:hypothetical protein VOM14_21940 [Paraburkholderia sp. MPAMCS5]|uniref:hypothetical protein n=1 Tax=Paraburkholderia sp. MPAMCS5 TaxID=3112563 RepID=UPI002E199F4B|nr:hypothetical protein [Paraburkholderia sp. MPAMCS5]
MTQATTKKPTKKAFHFPKAAAAAAAEETKTQAVAPAADAVKKKATAKKAPKAAAAVEPAQAKTEASSAKAANGAKARRVKKDQVVRDSFTMPKSDYDKIAALKQKCLAAGISVKKSELLRAGLLMLESAADKRLLAAVSAVEQVKTGRPTKH